MADLPSGRINDGTQPLLDEPSLIPFFSHDRVIAAAGGANGTAGFVRSFEYCQWHDDATWHHHEFTLHETESGLVSLCYSHDNQFREHGTPGKLDNIAKGNTALWIIRMVCSQLGLHGEHQLTLPELCWWASLNDLIDLIPEAPARRVLRMPASVVTGELKESHIAPERQPKQVIQQAAEQVKKIIDMVADPESPESFMRRPKRKRWESQKYTQWVKAQKCACCANQADDPHHIIGHGQGGMGTKAHDLFIDSALQGASRRGYTATQNFLSRITAVRLNCYSGFLITLLQLASLGQIKNKVCGGDLICVTFNWF